MGTRRRATAPRAGAALVLAVALAGCGGDDDAAAPSQVRTVTQPATTPPPSRTTTTTATRPQPPPATPEQPQPLPPTTTRRPSPLPAAGVRLRAAGFRVVPQPLPPDVPGVSNAFTTASGGATIYVFVFAETPAAAAYARAVAAQGRRSGGGVMARRVDRTVYVGTAGDARARRTLAADVGRVVNAARAPATPPAATPPTPPPPPPPPPPPTAQPRPDTVQARLRTAGFRVVAQPFPRDVPGVRAALQTSAGSIVVYVYLFESVSPARVYAATVAEQARASGGSVLGRRVNAVVYIGTATDASGRGELRTQLERVVSAGRG